MAQDLSDAELITAIDRFFMYYVSTAERLQRTAPWLEELDGGIERLREVIFDDALGLCDDLDAMMTHHVGAYADEWREVLEDPEKLAQFTGFVNDATDADPDLLYVVEREQVRPATADDRARAAAGELDLVDSERRPVMIAGSTLEVRA